MSGRWVLAAFGAAVAALSVGGAVMGRILAAHLRMSSPEVAEYTQAELDALSQEYSDSWMLIQHLPWFLAGGLVALSAAVALLALRAQRAASASATSSASSATASRDA